MKFEIIVNGKSIGTCNVIHKPIKQFLKEMVPDVHGPWLERTTSNTISLESFDYVENGNNKNN